jgi:hypothetical protein
MCLGNKKIYHLEAWVVKVMSLYKVGLRFCCKLSIDFILKLATLFGHRA